MYTLGPLPIAEGAQRLVEYLTHAYGGSFDTVSISIDRWLGSAARALQAVPPPLFIGAVALLARLAGGARRGAWALAVFAVIGLGLIWNLGYWRDLIDSLTLLLAAESLVLVLGVPLGILSASSRVFEQTLRPMLDVMQTMPAFVYLVPAVVFFGLGLVPAMIATTIFALPPLVRLTALGLRQVPRDLLEATQSFGATRWQLLLKVQLPAARPSILAGINQSIMLALSMVVVASMIGAGGLGGIVLEGVTRLDVGLAFVGGLCVVIMAVLLDRLTQALGRRGGAR